MKLAVTYENGNIFQHFGHTERFKIYDIEDGKVVDAAVVETGGAGHGALAGFLAQNNVQVLLCGGIGGGARAALAQAGVTLYGGVSGAADDAVQAFLDGKLAYDPNAQCAHHEHHDGGCGHHDGGAHGCGHADGHGCGGHGDDGHGCGHHEGGHGCGHHEGS